jgi:hypothetical protein
LYWDTRILCAPLFTTSEFFSIDCPTSGTLSTGETATTNGIPLGDANITTRQFDTLWYAIPASGNFSNVGGFRVLSYNEKVIVPGSSWVLLATRTHDNNTVKWVAGHCYFRPN